MKKSIFLLLIINFLLMNFIKAGFSEVKEIKLPDPILKSKVSIEETIAKRRSHRAYDRKKFLNLEQVSQLLWAAQGITGQGDGASFRAAPSAGALYPMELYVVACDGYYKYVPQEHKLIMLKEEDLRNKLTVVAYGQRSISEAPFNILMCAVYSRVTDKYGRRGEKYVHIEVGHIAENVHLQAVALELASVPIGAFNNAELKRAFNLPEDHEPLYIIPIGYPAKK